jgi:UDP-glucose 4-epimerase
VIKQISSKSKITFVDYKDAYKIGYEDMARRVPNISKIKSCIGWEPKKDLNKIIEDIYNSLITRT